MAKIDNAALARRWFGEVWNERRDATVHELLAPDALGHLEGLVSRGVDEFLSARAFLLGAFPDLRITVEATASEAENVVVRWSASATHGGDAMGMLATGTPVTFRGITWLRFSNGRIVEGWDAWNQGRLVSQLQAATAQKAQGVA